MASFWSQFNIRCNCLSPGTFPNLGNNTSKNEPNKVLDTDFLELLEKKCTLKKFGKPKDLLSSLEFLCSDKSDFITGQNIVVDGGWSAL